MTSIPALIHTPSSVMLAGLTLHLARGFGAAKPSDSFSKKKIKQLRGKFTPCKTCCGSGKKPCQFCDGTKLMIGFLGKRVPCVPCRETGTLGRPCVECDGMGFHIP